MHIFWLEVSIYNLCDLQMNSVSLDQILQLCRSNGAAVLDDPVWCSPSRHPRSPHCSISALAHADWLHGTVINFFSLDAAENC